MLFFFLALFSLKKYIGKLKKVSINNEDYQLYYLGIAIEGAMVTFLVAASFIDMFRSQIMYWMMLYCSCYIAVVSNKYPDDKASSTT
jgi:hypothetical protein